MYFAILAEDVVDSLPLRRQVREAHLERVQTLVDDGRVLVAGPHPAVDADDPGEAGFTGSLIIADFPSREDAKRWIDADPYTTAGVFARVTIKPFRLVLP